MLEVVSRQIWTVKGFVLCCTEEVLGCCVSHVRHKSPHAHTAAYHSVPTIWSVPKGSLWKYSLSVGSHPDISRILMHLNLSYSTPSLNLEWRYCQDWHHPSETFTIWHLNTWGQLPLPPTCWHYIVTSLTHSSELCNFTITIQLSHNQYWGICGRCFSGLKSFWGALKLKLG